MVRAGSWLGLVKTESDDPEHRAYVRAHQALLWLRTQLSEGQVTSVEAENIVFEVDGEERILTASPGQLQLHGALPAARLASQYFFEPQCLESVDLGPGGMASFALERGQLSCRLLVRDESLGRGGEHRCDLNLNLLHRKQRARRPR